jgi:hypothetical protein
LTAPEIRLAALCDHALVGQDGKVSILGVFRNISVTGLPAQHPRMFLVAILGLDAGTHAVVVRLRKPDGVHRADGRAASGSASELDPNGHRRSRAEWPNGPRW